MGRLDSPVQGMERAYAGKTNFEQWRQLRGAGGPSPPQDFQNDIFFKILLVLLIQCSICTHISSFSTFKHMNCLQYRG